MKRLFLISVLILVAFTPQSNAQPTLNSESQKQLVLSNLSSMPLCFTENRGQWDEKALFKAEAGGATFWYCRDEVVYHFTRDTDKLIEDGLPYGTEMPEGMPDKFNHPRYKKESMVLRAQFIGANSDAEIIGEDRLSHNNNYFIGNVPSKWATDVPNYSFITYKDIWPGIDLKYHGNGQGMKYDFIVNPGADISQIRVRYEGVDNLAITSNGDLQADTRFGMIYENIPSVYQETGSRKTEVAGRYTSIEPGVFGFEADNYNPNLPLVIDPELVYSTYLGGSALEYSYSITSDSQGNAYVAGRTVSTNFPVQEPYQTENCGNWDAFVTKLSPGGNSLVYSTYLGGNSDDYGYSIAIDGSGYAFVTGWTWSTNFPTHNPYQTFQGRAGYDDVFVTKISLEGDSLVYSTYLGGNDYDEGWGLVVDGSGNAYVAGWTNSPNYPTHNPYQTDQAGGDVFVTKLSFSGNSLIYSTYLGGSGYEYGFGIALDSPGNAYVTGVTTSSNFPTQNPYQTDLPGYDVFVTKLSLSGNSLIYSTYLGGDDEDESYAIAVNDSGNAYLTGWTYSGDFPVKNTYQINQPGRDAFVTKLSLEGDTLIYSTYLGGNSDDIGYDITIDSLGNAYVAGATYSTNFPTLYPSNQAIQGPFDAFVTKFSPEGESLVYSIYLGGNGGDESYGIAVDSFGNAYATGWTSSTNFPILNPYQMMYQTGGDGFVTKISAFDIYSIAATSGQNGIIFPSGVVRVGQGSDTTFIITPNIGHHVLDVLVDGNSVGPVSSYTFSDVITNHTIEASFAIDTFIIDASAGPNGTISPLESVIVNYGNDTTFTITPNIGYHILNVFVDSVSMGPLTSYSFHNVIATHSILATFAIDTLTITAIAGDHGSITPSGAVIVNYGSDTTFTITPNTGYHIADVLVDSVSVGPETSYTFTAVTANHTISAYFAINTFTITASVDPNGTISPSGTAIVNYGSDTTFTITPNIGYHVAALVIDDSTVGPVLSYHFADVTTDHTISASFAVNTYTISATSASNGSITPAGEIQVNYGANQTFIIAADSGYHENDVLVDSVSMGPIAEYTFLNISANHSINVSFAINVYIISASSGPNGRISPSGIVNIEFGKDTTFVMIPDSAYHVFDVLVDGNVIGPVDSFIFSDVAANHSISVGFDINTFLIIATAGQHGTISPSGVVFVDYGTDTTFTITPEPDYRIADVLVDGASVGPVPTFTFNDIINGHVITASFSDLCDYIVGDVNNSGLFNGIDVSYSVGYFKGGPVPPYICECNGSSWYVAGDVNGSCSFNGIDVSYMVAYFKGGSWSVPCPDCPPAIMITSGKENK